MNTSALLEAVGAELTVEPLGRLGDTTGGTLSKGRLPPMFRFSDEQLEALAHLIVEALNVMKATHNPFMIEQDHWRMRANPLHPVRVNRDRVPPLARRELARP
jgi:hypothetical protein